MNQVKRLIAFLLIGSSAMFLTCCARSASDLVGTWRECQEKPVDVSEIQGTGGYFIFYNDGKFEGYKIPIEYFIDTSPERVNVFGTWDIQKPSTIFDVSRIDLVFSPINDFPFGFDNVLYLSIDAKILFHGMGGDRIIFATDEKGCNNFTR
jgi:hypothetical protein